MTRVIGATDTLSDIYLLQRHQERDGSFWVMQKRVNGGAGPEKCYKRLDRSLCGLGAETKARGVVLDRIGNSVGMRVG